MDEGHSGDAVMVALPNLDEDPTLEAMFTAMEAIKAAEPRRGYLGASQIGDDCERKLWYGFNNYPRPPMERKGIMATEDGHRTEDLVIERLRLVPGIEIWTRDDKGEQFGFSKYDDKYGGHYDGVVLGLLQAPKTPHILEVKACNEKIFNAFLKAKEDYGEKNALQQWNATYYAQAQTYMGEEKLERHYLLVALAGGRDIVSCRTEFNSAEYHRLDQKAKRIISAKTEPVRISDNKSFYKCKFCDFADICHKR